MLSLRCETQLESTRPVQERLPYITRVADEMESSGRYAPKALWNYATRTAAELEAWAESNPLDVTFAHVAVFERLKNLARLGRVRAEVQ